MTFQLVSTPNASRSRVLHRTPVYKEAPKENKNAKTATRPDTPPGNLA